MNYTITKRHINPINLICLVLLSIVTVTVLTANKPATNAPATEIRQDDEYYNTRRPSWKDMKDYQVQIVGKYAIFSNYGEPVFVVPLNKKCNLSRAIQAYDQQLQDRE